MQPSLNPEPVVLVLPSDLPADLKAENDLLKAKLKGLEMRNEGLQRRITEILEDWRQLQNKVHMNEISDILCDFIAEFYHNELLNYIRANSETLGLQQKPNSWNEISVMLSEEARINPAVATVKQACMKAGGFDDAEWNALYDFKRTRNVRVHPRRNKRIVQRVMRELPNGILRQALSKMFKRLKL